MHQIVNYLISVCTFIFTFSISSGQNHFQNGQLILSVEGEDIKYYLKGVEENYLSSRNDSTLSFEDIKLRSAINFASSSEWVLCKKEKFGIWENEFSNPSIDTFLYIEPFEWQWLHLVPVSPNSNLKECYLRRPISWGFNSRMLQVGDTVHIELKHQNIDEHLRISLIEPSYIDTRIQLWPEDSQFVYRPITGWFKRLAPEVWNYVFSPRDTISCTPEHPFWSETRQAWVEAGELSVGEEVSTADGGRTRLVAKERRGAGPEYVYNLEVWRDHNYFVGSSNILVQDGCSGAVKKAIIDAMLQRANIHSKLWLCRESAKSMRDYLLSKGIKDFDIVLLKTVDKQTGKFFQINLGSFVHNYGSTPIATNGIHVFLVINGKAYDNLTKGVIDAQEYIKSFYTLAGFKVKDVLLKHTDDLDGDFTDF